MKSGPAVEKGFQVVYSQLDERGNRVPARSRRFICIAAAEEFCRLVKQDDPSAFIKTIRGRDGLSAEW